MRGNSLAQFLGGKGGVSLPPYPVRFRAIHEMGGESRKLIELKKGLRQTVQRILRLFHSERENWSRSSSWVGRKKCEINSFTLARQSNRGYIDFTEPAAQGDWGDAAVILLDTHTHLDLVRR